MRNQFRKSIKCELRYSVFPKSILEAKYTNEVSEFSLQRNMNGYAEMVRYGIRIKTPYFRHFFLPKLKNPVFNGFIRRKQGSFLEPVFIRNVCGFSSIILLQTRQGFLTQSAAKFAEKTCAYACEDGFLMCIKIYETILPSQYKITALPVNFRNNIITHYELRITH